MYKFIFHQFLNHPSLSTIFFLIRRMYNYDKKFFLRWDKFEKKGKKMITIRNGVVTSGNVKRETVRANNQHFGNSHLDIIGNGNTVTGMYCTVQGDGNRVTGMYCKVTGDNNVLTGMYCKVRGNNNTSTGMYSKAFGEGNKVSGMYSKSYAGSGKLLSKEAPPSSSSSSNSIVIDGNGNTYGNVVYCDDGTTFDGSMVNNVLQSVFGGGSFFSQSFSGETSNKKQKMKNKKQKKSRLPEAMENEPDSQEGETECSVCCQRSVKTVIKKCMHSNLCVTCARKIGQDPAAKCPTCRAPIVRIQRIFA